MLNRDNYFEKDEFMSVSAWKRYNKCEYAGTIPFDDSNKSTALLIGSYVDAYVEGTLTEFVKNNPDVFSSNATDEQKCAIEFITNNFVQNGFNEILPQFAKKDGELKKGISDKAFVQAILDSTELLERLKITFPNLDKPQLKSEFKLAEEICNFIDKDPRLQKFLGGQKQVVMTGEISNVPFKIMMDSYDEGIAISDLKVMRSVTDSNGNFVDFITPWKYDVQLACYQEVVYQNTGEKLPCYICAVTKEEPINSVIVQIPQVILDRALYEVESSIEKYYQVHIGEREPEKCGVCKPCVSDRRVTPLISMLEFSEV